MRENIRERENGREVERDGDITMQRDRKKASRHCVKVIK